MVIGTPTYMSPEQATGGEIDGRSDQYSLGILFYEMLAGKPPFAADEASILLRMHILAPPPALPDSVPAPLTAVVFKLLEKSRNDRYASAREVIRPSLTPKSPNAQRIGTLWSLPIRNFSDS